MQTSQTLKTVKFFAVAGCVGGFLGVSLGAFGAHGLKGHFERFPDLRAIYETAVEYHMYHALALLGVAWAAQRAPSGLTTLSGLAFLLGILIFSGSLYVLSITNIRWFGAITPIGGAAFLVGWATLALSLRRTRS